MPIRPEDFDKPSPPIISLANAAGIELDEIVCTIERGVNGVGRGSVFLRNDGSATTNVEVAVNKYWIKFPRGGLALPPGETRPIHYEVTYSPALEADAKAQLSVTATRSDVATPTVLQFPILVQWKAAVSAAPVPLQRTLWWVLLIMYYVAFNCGSMCAFDAIWRGGIFRTPGMIVLSIVCLLLSQWALGSFASRTEWKPGRVGLSDLWVRFVAIWFFVLFFPGSAFLWVPAIYGSQLLSGASERAIEDVALGYTLVGWVSSCIVLGIRLDIARRRHARTTAPPGKP